MAEWHDGYGKATEHTHDTLDELGVPRLSEDGAALYIHQRIGAYGDKRAREAVEALAEEVRDYLEAQDALDNWELQSINRDPHDRVMRRRNDARRDLDAMLAAASGMGRNDGTQA